MKKLFRSRKEKMIFGVCGGIADYYGFDPSIVRLVLVALTLAWGIGLIGYIVAAIVVPLEPETPIS